VVTYLVRALLIAALVIAEVALWQWRMVIATRGKRASAMALGAFGALLQITAISQVVSDAHDPLGVGAYAAGVGIGVLLGLIAGDRLTPGTIGLTIVATAPGVVRDLRKRGWRVVAHDGHDEDGPVTVLSVAVNRRHESRLLGDLSQLAPEALWSIADVRT
jgi:uncharacterized protein YebE (UPF0316 family)